MALRLRANTDNHSINSTNITDKFSTVSVTLRWEKNILPILIAEHYPRNQNLLWKQSIDFYHRNY